MCGIFGFIGHVGGPTVKALKDIAVGVETRGRHAFGIAWIDANGRLHSYKQAGRIGLHLDILDETNGAKAVIGHTRFATHGDVGDNVNNHPHPCDGGWFVHNGIVSNYMELIREHRLLPQSRCDSEVLGLLVERLKGSLLKRVTRTVNLVAQDAPLCMAGIWNRPGRVIVVKRGNPLFVGRGRKGNVYFSSCHAGLPGTVKAVEESMAFEFNLNSHAVAQRHVRAMSKFTAGAKFLGSNWFGGEGKNCEGKDCGPEWKDDLEVVPDPMLDEDETESLFDDNDPDPNDPTAVQEAIRKQEAEQEKRRERLSVTQRKALNLLESASGTRVNVPAIDPIARLHELKANGTINGHKINRK